jgi:hypothetical protein
MQLAAVQLRGKGFKQCDACVQAILRNSLQIDGAN